MTKHSLESISVFDGSTGYLIIDIHSDKFPIWFIVDIVAVIAHLIFKGSIIGVAFTNSAVSCNPNTFFFAVQWTLMHLVQRIPQCMYPHGLISLVHLKNSFPHKDYACWYVPSV